MNSSLRVLILAVSLLFSFAAQAYDACLTPAESRQSYRNCMNFLQMTPNQQTQVAGNAGYSRAAGLKMCQMQKRKGLAGMLAAEREYCRAISGGSKGGKIYPNPNACSYNFNCAGYQHCVDRQCVDKVRVQCKNSHSCSPGGTCISGECR